MKPVFDCTWINARHYRRDVGDGVARVTSTDLASGIREQFAMRAKNGKKDLANPFLMLKIVFQLALFVKLVVCTCAQI